MSRNYGLGVRSRVDELIFSLTPWLRCPLGNAAGSFAVIEIVGDKHAITDPQAQAPYLLEMRDMFRGHTPMVLRPGSVADRWSRGRSRSAIGNSRRGTAKQNSLKSWR